MDMPDKGKEAVKKALELCPENSSMEVRYEYLIYERVEFINGKLSKFKTGDDYGIGIKIIKNNKLGFAATNCLNQIEQAVSIALEQIKETKQPFLSEVKIPAVKDLWASPIQTDPFSISFEKKLEELEKVCKVMLSEKGIKTCKAFVEFKRIFKIFASSAGSWIEQSITTTGLSLAAFSIKDGEIQFRSYPGPLEGNYLQAGWEAVEEYFKEETAARIAAEVVALHSAPALESETMDVILKGDQLALQVHESCGHAAESDRVFGSEKSFAGDTFLSPDMLNSFRYGSEVVNITADATLKKGVGSFGYDDEGVKASRVYLIKNGVFQNFLTNKQTAKLLNVEPGGMARAASWRYLPLIRMTNINLLPGESSLEEMISEVRNGVLLEGIKSWSIDDKRLDFHFATQIGYRIKHGKIVHIVKNPMYYGTTPEFWKNVEMIGRESELIGFGNCAKGEPVQVLSTGHLVSPILVRRVKVGSAQKK